MIFKKDPDEPQKDATSSSTRDPVQPMRSSSAAAPATQRALPSSTASSWTSDPYYRERREKTTIITLACPRPLPGCFCTSVGGGPADKTGSDVLVTEVDDGYYHRGGDGKRRKACSTDPALQDGAPYKDGSGRAGRRPRHGQVKQAFSGGKNVKISTERFALRRILGRGHGTSA